MLGHSAQLPDRFMGPFPIFELTFNCLDHARQCGEVTIMEAQSARQFPDPLDRVQIWAIGRQIAQYELGFLLNPPIGVKFGMMILRIVNNDDYSAPGSAAYASSLW